MKKGLVIADAGPVISLALADALGLLHEIFEEFCIPQAVWEEVTRDQNTKFYLDILSTFEGRVRSIAGKNYLSSLLDYGESEALILYKELNASYLMIDDRKARQAAEGMGITCVVSG
ncbi:MAG: hypothetical protein LC670_01820 [Flavobacteriales bacterium]|nr:hypothetical protein [Flavobacteriales bacterium]